MQGQLRKLISQHDEQLNQINWESYPIPELLKSQANKLNKQGGIIKKEKQILKNDRSKQIQVPQQPSKAKLKANKMLEKIEQKLKKQRGQESVTPQKKFFIGFNSQPIKPEIPTIIPTLRQFPSPVVPPSIGTSLVKNSQVSNSNSVKPQPKKEQNQQKKSIEKSKKLAKINEAQTERKLLIKRFTEFNALKKEPIKATLEVGDQEYSEIPIVGKNLSIEKSYLRITGRPDPQLVRPEHILVKSLELLKKKYKEGADYLYMLDQFKSLRQDLTVQHISNSLTVKVYQQNMKVSLFSNDNIEAKNCLLNLWQLYREGIYDKKETRDIYISYQLLTLVLQQKYKELEYMLTLLPQGSLEHKQVQSVLKLKRALMLGNYKFFFDYYSSREQLCRSLLNQYIDRVRIKCMLMISKTFGEKVSLKLIADLIEQDQDVLQILITQEGGVIKNGIFFAKESYQPLSKSEYLVIKKARLSFD